MVKQQLVVVFLSSILCLVVTGGADHEIEQVSHPNVEARDVGPLMTTGSHSKYSYNSGYSSQGGYKPYDCPSCRYNFGSSSPRSPNAAGNYRSYSSMPSSFGPSLRQTSHQYHKNEKEEFVNGQQVYDLHHEKEYKDGRLIKDIRQEKTPQDFGHVFPQEASPYVSNFNYPARAAPPRYVPNDGREPSSIHHQQQVDYSSSSSSSANRPMVSYSSPLNTRSSSQRFTGSFHGFDDDKMQMELEKMRQEMEKQSQSFQEHSLGGEPSYGGSSHRTEVQTHMKYVNGEPIYVKTERKYRNGKLVHNVTTEQGPEDLDSDQLLSSGDRHFSNRFQESFKTERQPHYASIPTYPSSSSSTSSSFQSNKNVQDNPVARQQGGLITQYSSHPYSSYYPSRSTGYQRSSTRYQNSQNPAEHQTNSPSYPIDRMGSVPRQNVDYLPRNVYKTEVREKFENTSTLHHQPLSNPNERVIEENAGRYSALYPSYNYLKQPESSSNYFVQSNRPSSSNYYSSSSSYKTSGGHKYMPDIKAQSRVINNYDDSISRYRPSISNPTTMRPSTTTDGTSLRSSQTSRSSSSLYQEPRYSNPPRRYNPLESHTVSLSPNYFNPRIYTTQTSTKDEKKQTFSLQGSSNDDVRTDDGYPRYSDDNYYRSSPISGSINKIDQGYQEPDTHLVPGGISEPLVERGDQVPHEEDDRYDISPFIDGADDDEVVTNANIPFPEVVTPVPNVMKYPYDSYDTRPLYHPVNYTMANSSSRESHSFVREIPSNRIEATTRLTYVNGKLAKQIIIYKYYENNVLIHENTTEKTRDEMASEGIDVYGLDLTQSDLLKYGPRDQSIHSQKHESYKMKVFKSGFPVYEVNEIRKFQDGTLIHESREEKNEDDFLRANRLLIESQNRNNIPYLANRHHVSRPDFNVNPQGYVKKHETHQEEEYINGQKVYSLHHERQFHNGNLLHENRTELGPRELGVAIDDNQYGGYRRNFDSGSHSSYDRYDTSQGALKTGCVTCGNSNRFLQMGSQGILQSLGIPRGQQKSSTFRQDVNIEEHYENGRMVKGVEDNKQWNDDVLTDANTEHYYTGPSRTSMHHYLSGMDNAGGSFRTSGVGSSDYNNRLIHLSRERKEECTYNPCINGASCRHNGRNPVCICLLGFKGSRCEEVYCPNSYCRYGGKCSISSEGSHECECYEGFTGDRCTTRVYKIKVGPSN